MSKVESVDFVLKMLISSLYCIVKKDDFLAPLLRTVASGMPERVKSGWKCYARTLELAEYSLKEQLKFSVGLEHIIGILDFCWGVCAADRWAVAPTFGGLPATAGLATVPGKLADACDHLRLWEL